MSRSSISRLLAVAGAAAALSACGGGQEQAADSRPFNATDVNFVQKMLPHHMQALRTSEVVLERGQEPRIKAIAGKIVRGQKREIAQMQGFLREFGASPQPPPPDQKQVWDRNVAEERAADSAREAETVFLTNMVPHHSAAIPMAQMEIEMGKFGAARKLAEQIKKTQRQEITEMTRILRQRAEEG